MTASAFPVVFLQGTPRDRGRQHGEQFRREVGAAIDALKAEHRSISYAAAHERAVADWPLVLKRAPEVTAELQGIAEGSDCDLMDIFLGVGFEFFETPSPTGCSAIALKGPDGAIVAQNWDAPPHVSKQLALFVHVGPDGFEQAVIASVGGLAWVGCNRHGLALLTNDLMLRSKARGLPSQVVRRVVLAQPSVAGAIETMRALPHMAGRSYLLGDASGDIAGVEVSPRAGVRVSQGGTAILHTNHAVDPDVIKDEDEAELMKSYPSSRHRLDVLKRIVPLAPSVADIVVALRNREGFPNAICKACSQSEQTQTAFSIIVECAGPRLHLCPASPAERDYYSILLPGRRPLPV